MKKFIKLLPVFWLVFGCVFGGASVYGYYLLLDAKDNAQQLTHPMQPPKNSRQQSEQRNTAANFNAKQIQPVTPEAYATAQLRYEATVNQWGIGALYIPSAGIQTKILAGMANENLMVAVGTYSPEQQLGKGNYVLLAHNLVQGGGALGNLPKTKLQQVIYATDFATVYEYVATKNDTVNQSAGHLLEPPAEEEAPQITLFRCEGGLTTPHRAVVQGEFHKSYPAEDASADVKIGLGLGNMKETPQRSEKESAELPNTTASAEQSAPVNTKKQRFSQKKPVYSWVQKAAIRCFGWANQYPIQIAIAFLGILSSLSLFSNKFSVR